MSRTVRVLIVDDSAMVRRVLMMGLSSDPEIEVIGSASNATQAWDMMQAQRPDVITLDVEMPATDGVTFLSRYMQVMPIPTVMISALTSESAPVTLQAMEAGAVDVIEKPSLGVEGMSGMMRDICERVRAAASARPVLRRARVRQAPPVAPPPQYDERAAHGTLMAIGSSTGGVQALSRILPMFPVASPPILIVQHMPEGFTGAFARRLDAVCNMSVCEARDGEEVRFGTVYIAPGGQRHMTVRREGASSWSILLEPGDPVSYSRPSVDVLFASVAQQAGRKAIAALLTGMGRDGARGMLAIRQAGGTTFAQDEATSVVYGMPFAAVELGAAKETLPLDDIPDRMLRCITVSQARAARP